MPRPIKVVDLFAGPGGLGEGFATAQSAGGKRLYEVVLSVEQDRSAHQTLRLRHFLHQFDDLPPAYFRLYRNEIGVEELYKEYPRESEVAANRALRLSLSSENIERLSQAVDSALIDGRISPWVLIGGPPCQAYSIAGRSRNKGKADYVPEEDERQTLYVEYLQVVANHAPAVFVMENVKGLTSAKLDGRSVFTRILGDLRDPQAALKQVGRNAR